MMKVQVRGESVDMPCSQWVEFVASHPDNRDIMVVKMCGTGAIKTVPVDSITGFELSENISLLCRITGKTFTS
jgi:hypothetical protein